MSDTHLAATPSTPTDHVRSEHQHRRWLNGMIVAVVALLAVGAAVIFREPLVYAGNSVVAWTDSFKTKTVFTSVDKPVTATSMVNTDAGRVVVRKHTIEDIDVVGALELAQKQAAAAQADAANARREAATMVANAREFIETKSKQFDEASSAYAKRIADELTTLNSTMKTGITQAARFQQEASTAPQPQSTTVTRVERGQQAAAERTTAAGSQGLGNRVRFDRSGIPDNWEIRGGDFGKAQNCKGTVYVKEKRELPDGGVRNILGCR